jgi:hypothetical protein
MLPCMFCKQKPTLNLTYQNTNITLCASCVKNIAGMGIPHTVRSQCCECGVFLDGPCKGCVVSDESGRVLLIPTCSHGMCIPCANKKMADWIELKAARLIQKSGILELGWDNTP